MTTVNDTTFEEQHKYLDNYFSKEMAFEDFLKATKQAKWTVHKFKKALKAYCSFNNYIFNPKDLQNAPGRIVQKIEGKSQEAIFIRTVENPTGFNKVSIETNFKSEDEIFNEQ
jgi:hypothetical protein